MNEPLLNAREEPCQNCDGDGYTETWNDDQTGVVITPCTDCGPAPGEHDR